ncbi:MAG: hypothetical protein HY812_02160 [Planctomycetes bacterium]|nr:hypothetical protein [Planctomycetota bacterium]
MARRFALLLIPVLCFGWARLTHGQHLPSPGTSFDQLLGMTNAAIEAGDGARAARLALLVRSRLLVRPDPTRDDAMVCIFEDMTTGAAERAREYLAAAEKFGDGLGSLGPVEDALGKVAAPLIAQVDSLIEKKYKECALFVLEPLWALDPRAALDALARIEAIPDSDAAEGDDPLASSLRLSESMSRGMSGAALASIPVDDPNGKPIEELRRNSALAMVDVSGKALAKGFPWVAIDLAGIATSLFPIYPNRFESVTADARKRLVKERAVLSKAVVSELFMSGRKALDAQSWRVTADSVQFPPSKGKPGLLVTKDPIEGDYRFAMELSSDFERAPQGFAFGYKSDDDYCAAIFMNHEGHPAVKIQHYVNGEPKRLHSWDGPAGIDTKDKRAAWPIFFELHGRTLWLQIGNSPWILCSRMDMDFLGSIGLYVCEESEGKNAKASLFEFERLGSG